jgi:hypothetical protein
LEFWVEWIDAKEGGKSREVTKKRLKRARAHEGLRTPIFLSLLRLIHHILFIKRLRASRRKENGGLQTLGPGPSIIRVNESLHMPHCLRTFCDCFIITIIVVLLSIWPFVLLEYSQGTLYNSFFSNVSNPRT